MKIWELKSEADKFLCLGLLDSNDWKNFDDIDGRSLKDIWNPVKIEFIKSKKKKTSSDAPYLTSDAPVFSQRAIDVLKDFLDDSVELLPLSYDKPDALFLVNVLKVVDCIDQNKAEFRRYPDGRIMWCEKYVFYQDKVSGQNIFKIPETPRGLVLVSDEFRNTVLGNNLTGFVFKEVWDSEKVET